MYVLQGVRLGGTMADATQILSDIATKLDELANQVVNMVGDDRTFMEIWAWNNPAINRHEFADLIRKPIALINRMENMEVSEADFNRLQSIPAQLAYFQGNSIQNLPSGNAYYVYLTATSFVSNLENILTPYVKATVDWTEIKDRKMVPAAMAIRLKNLEATINGIINSTDDLQDKIEKINSAHSAAEALPAEREFIRQVREEIEAFSRSTKADKAALDDFKQDAADIGSTMQQSQETSNNLLAAAGVAYQASTAVGLGREFDDRAKALAKEVKVLACALTLVLLLIATISFYRADSIHKLLMAANYQPDKIWMEIAVSAASLLAPIWLAWMLTKQIGQRFRLAEDYGFKASVAKAFAGYRAEATRLDEEDGNFAKRLFTSALDRIEEPPLRYVEPENHGSPLQDFIAFVLNLKGVRKGLEQVRNGEVSPISDTADKGS
jgi:hypothetical protein